MISSASRIGIFFGAVILVWFDRLRVCCPQDPFFTHGSGLGHSLVGFKLLKVVLELKRIGLGAGLDGLRPTLPDYEKRIVE